MHHDSMAALRAAGPPTTLPAPAEPAPPPDAASAPPEPEAPEPPPPPPAVARWASAPALQPALTRGFLLIAALGCLAAALLCVVLAGGHRPVWGQALAYGALGAAMLLGWRAPQAWLAATATLGTSLLAAVIAGGALVLGWGLSSPGLAMLGLMVCALAAAAGIRAGIVLAAVSAGAVLVVATAAAPAVAPKPAVPWAQSEMLLATLLLGIAAGLACGAMLSRVARRHMRSVQDREQRFRALLALAADAHWELDARYRLQAASGQDTEADTVGVARALRRDGGLGKVPWELPRFGCEPEVLDELLADLDARQPFRDRPVTWAARDGSERSFLVSGEPRFDARGVFTGYWGVARDVTQVRAAQAALAATESRYQELFTRIPSPLVLHRHHRVLDANPAALAMFGHETLAAMAGSELHGAFEGGDSRERERRRIEHLMTQPPGTALPVSDFKLRVQGRTLAVRATAVRVDAEGGPATLAIFLDDTERLAAEDALRRSEAMLAHLVATSPDLITLTDLASGRYAMVNHAFERVTGWTAAEAIGRTSLELGIWRDETQRQAFVRQVGEQRSVTDVPVEFVARHGGVIPMRVSAARFVMDHRDYLVINARDLTESERARLEREAILNNASIGIALTREQRFLHVNPHLERMLGVAPGAMLGRPLAALWADPAEHEASLARELPRLREGQRVEMEVQARRDDGALREVQVRGTMIDPQRGDDAGIAWIVEDVTERREFERALARARDEAEAASRAKTAFLANTSHELRTPLNGLIGLTRLAREPECTEAQRIQYLAQVADSAQALSDIISDILDISKIEAGKLLLENTVFDLGETLRALKAAFEPQAQARGLALHVDDAAAQGAVRGDPLRVRQVLGNYLSNAIKFTPAGRVTLAVRRQGERVRFEVTDSGPGIDAATQARLFRPFTQADESTTRRFGGTGLGLSICRELAHLMGGEVGVYSGAGEGSTFWAEFPLPVAQRPPPQQQQPSALSLQGKRVLMVEDNPVNMMIAVTMLQRWGVEVDEATDGGQAVDAVLVAAAAGRPYDAVLMDVQMPLMSGHEATRALRAHPAGARLPVVALTAAALVSEREEALQSGMNDFLTKPIDAQRLHDTLLHWVHADRSPAGGR